MSRKDYASFTEDWRQAALSSTLDRLLREKDRYAALNLGEAAVAIRRHFPTAERVGLMINEASDGGYTVDLVSVRGPADELLWHVDDLDEPDEVLDDTGITDRIAIARAHGAEFPPAREPGRDGRDTIIYEMHLPTVLEEAARAS